MKNPYFKTFLIVFLSIFISCSSEDSMDENTNDTIDNNTDDNPQTTGNNSITLTVDGEDIIFDEYKAQITEFDTQRYISVEGTTNPEGLTVGTAFGLNIDINKLHTDPTSLLYIHKDTTYSSFPSESNFKIDITENDGNSFKATFSGNVVRDFLVDGSFKTFSKTIENGVININNIDTQILRAYSGTESKNILKATIDSEEVWFYDLKTSELTGNESTIYLEADTEKTFDRSIDFEFTKNITGNLNITDFDYSGDNGTHSLNVNGIPLDNASLNFEATVNNDEMLIATFSGVVSKTSGEEVKIENGYIEYHY